VGAVPRASVLQLLQYVTGALMVLLVSWHLAMRIPWLRGVDSFMETLDSTIVYQEITAFNVLLLLLAYATLFHGVNGLRIILLELRHGKYWDKAVNAAAVIVFIVFAAIATHTVVALPPLE
jgi:succinate dehydrogenase / fumarate reductase membrane anchor subunit